MQTLILTIVVLGIIVFVHELGHFLTAKWAGIGVPRFSIGLGPRVIGFKIGETDYCLSAIPFGGYVKLAGMEGEEAFEGLEGGSADEAVPPEKRFENKSIGQRLIVISAGVAMNFLLGWVIYVGLAWHDGIPTIPGTVVAGVDSTAVREYPALAALGRGDAIASVDGRSVRNWYEINEAITEVEGPVSIALSSGELIRVPAVDEAARREISAALQPLVPAVIAELEADGPAARAGLREGDRIISIDGIETPSFAVVSQLVRERPNRLVSVVVERVVDGEPRLLSLTLETGSTQAPRPSDGRFVDIGWLGVGSRIDKIELGSVEAVITGTEATWRAGTLILGGLYQLVTGEISLRSLGGPVAIGQLTGHFARQGVGSLLAWVALFSINLAILNLLPIPVLDGGHILFLAIEATRGRPLSSRQKMRLSQVGLAFLVLLMAWAFTADILRLVGF
jgi:regulator of sigma E protease